MEQHIALLLNGEVVFSGEVDHYELERASEVGGDQGVVMLRLTYTKW